MTTLRLKKFDMSSIDDNKRCIFIGKTGTGKSYLVRDYLYHRQQVPLPFVISATEEFSPFYKKIVPKRCIKFEYNQEDIQKFLARQKETKFKKDEEIENYGSSNIDERAILILDDCLYDDTWARTKEIREILMNGRHMGISLCVTMQYPLGIPPILRTQVEYVFILRENIPSNRKRIYEQYAAAFGSYDVFCQVMDQCTEDYHCLVLYNGSKTNKLEDSVFWYKAEQHPDFQIGHPSIWKYDQKNPVSSRSKQSDNFIMQTGGKRKQIVNVEKSDLPNLF